MENYLPRLVDGKLDQLLKISGAVEICGPKWSGKTTSAMQKAASSLFLDDEPDSIAMGKAYPSMLLDGPDPRLIDEWQLCPPLWDAVRREVDRRNRFGQFILTGSATPDVVDYGSGEKRLSVVHSGFGRIARLHMRTMSLFESGDSPGTVSLSKLFDAAEPVYATSRLDLEDMAYLLCRGGWPGAVRVEDRKLAVRVPATLLDELLENDLPRLVDLRKTRSEVLSLLRSYARMESSQAPLSSILNDMTLGGNNFSRETVGKYIGILDRLYIIEELDAWNPNLRSKAAIQTTPTRHFSDPALAAAALGAGPESLMKDLNTFGLLFEGMVVRDLRIYAQTIDGTVHHYRDSSGLEADAVIQLADGRWAPVEVKLFNPDRVDEGARNLIRLAQRVDGTRLPAPSFKMVVTAGPKAYVREDGVFVVPLALLGP
ncbi:MAG: DUF4143 domain-containing protein [Spirochaetes bacterium]|uniref:DUF4143 domain-containing protein n=1 Tax=Candidatus Aphodenecus pullistercoris TaxID=2840669 RepID=A0A9D9E965_9SPIR|nr:DUF4143 domain-containing protein [Candidatus Aphodenecus pullistercoris]